jgi:hypothetical protein
MLRILLEQSLSADEVDKLFEQQAQHQYHRALLFSTVVLMSLVVCGISPSINAAYQSKAKGIGVRIPSVYNKLNGLEPGIIEALVRQSVSQAQLLIEQLHGQLPGLLPSYRVKILDGSQVGSAPLPGHALVILDPALMLAIDVFACEDGHTQERA